MVDAMQMAIGSAMLHYNMNPWMDSAGIEPALSEFCDPTGCRSRSPNLKGW